MIERSTSSGRVVTWKPPDAEPLAPEYAVEVEGLPLSVYPAAVRHEIVKPPKGIWTHTHGGPSERAAFVIFDFEGRVRIAVRPARPFQNAWVWPTSAGIVPRREGDLLHFELDRPQCVTLLLDDDSVPLHFFVAAPERERPRPDDPNVLYFGPGRHEVSALSIQSGQTLYLAGGAVVRARLASDEKGRLSERINLVTYPTPVVHARGVRDIRIAGRGILDGSLLPHPAKNLIRLEGVRNARLEGIVLRDSSSWNVHIAASEDVLAEGLRILSGRLNSDGINPVNSRRVVIRDCFIRNRDDGIAVKTLRPEPPGGDVRAERCILWSDWGYPLGVTYETRAAITNVLFRDCDILFTRHWALGVRVVDAATVDGVAFEDIRVEDFTLPTRRFGAPPCPIQLLIVKDMWGADAAPGRIRNVAFRNILFRGGPARAVEILGFDPDHRVEGVLLDRVILDGRPLRSLDAPLVKTNAHIADIRFGE